MKKISYSIVAFIILNGCGNQNISIINDNNTLICDSVETNPQAIYPEINFKDGNKKIPLTVANYAIVNNCYSNLIYKTDLENDNDFVAYFNNDFTGIVEIYYSSVLLHTHAIEDSKIVKFSNIYNNKGTIGICLINTNLERIECKQ